MADQNKENFASDRHRASEAGQKGGHASQGDMGSRQGSQSSGKTGQQQSGGSFANDPSRATEAGRKGGEHSGAGKR